MLEAMAVEIGMGGDESCPFCKEKDNQGRTNDFSNSPSKLGTALGDEPEWRIEVPHPMAGDMTIENRLRTNAHHLIPADASFNPHPKIKQLLAKGSEVGGDVGYGVNHRNNGYWLPSYPEDYQATNVKTVPITWGQMTTEFPDMQHRITVLAMRHTKRQFHDAHPDYSSFVSQCLDKICEKVVAVAGKHTCQTPVEPLKKPWAPPYALTARLDGLSSRLRGLLSGLPKGWREPAFTSSHAKRYHLESALPSTGAAAGGG